MNALTVLTSEIRQLDGLYSLNDLHKASGAADKHRPNQFMRLGSTHELIREIRCADLRIIPFSIVSGRGKTQGTYVCRELVYAYAMWISPKFHLQVIRAFDALQSAPSAPQAPLGAFIALNGPAAQLAGQRYLVTFNDEGTGYAAQPIAPDCAVMTTTQFLKSIIDPNGLIFRMDDTGLLFDAVERLQGIIRRRHAYFFGRDQRDRP